MSSEQVSNINVLSEKPLPTPREIKSSLPLSERAEQTVLRAREQFAAVLERRDSRKILIVGPCSIHDLSAAEEYASKLSELTERVSDVFLVIMRVYFCKPRTTVGWKGFLNDPRLDDSFRIDEGLYKAREFLLKLAEMDLPVGTEVLDSMIPQYVDDLITWNAIGARTAESQLHREISSGLSTPVGFKNGTDGNIHIAINALKSVSTPHHFVGMDQDGRVIVFQTRGNKHAHVVLRGGKQPNYDSVSISLCEQALEKEGLPVNIVVDCSHGNSNKNHELQPLVFDNCVNQIVEGNTSIVGMMLESNLQAGSQSLSGDLSSLQYGVSVTDACIDWAATEKIVLEAAERFRGL